MISFKLEKKTFEENLSMEKFFDKKVFLKLFVKVRKDWRSKENDLKRFGY